MESVKKDLTNLETKLDSVEDKPEFHVFLQAISFMQKLSTINAFRRF